MSHIEQQVQDLQWQELHQFPGTGQVKILRDSPESGAKTMIVKLPPGGKIEPHSHPGVVQHYILEGQYEQHGRRIVLGRTACCRGTSTCLKSRQRRVQR